MRQQSGDHWPMASADCQTVMHHRLAFAERAGGIELRVASAAQSLKTFLRHVALDRRELE